MKSHSSNIAGRKRHSRFGLPTPILAQLGRRFSTDRRIVAGVGSLAAGALGIALAELIGLGEIAFGSVAAYATYKAIRKRR